MVGRRQFLNLAAASLLLVSGCATFRSGSDLDTYQEELRRLLDDIAENYGEQLRLTSIARRIEIRSHELVAEHQEFVDTLNSLMSTRDVTEVQLMQSVDSYSGRRKWLRNDLLQLQDELHNALAPDEWAEVITILNRTGQAVARSSVSGV
jgi:hypothetical protein